jgi:uncharacterized membrane protein
MYSKNNRCKILEKIKIYRTKFILTGLLILVGLACFLISFNIILPKTDLTITSSIIISNFFSTVCHQNQQKVISISDCSFIVCSRCTGIYFGTWNAIIISLLFGEKIKISWRLVILGCSLILIDVIGSSLGIYEYSKITALITGVIFSVISSLFILTNLLRANENK